MEIHRSEAKREGTHLFNNCTVTCTQHNTIHHHTTPPHHTILHCCRNYTTRYCSPNEPGSIRLVWAGGRQAGVGWSGVERVEDEGWVVLNLVEYGVEIKLLIGFFN